MLKGGFYGKYQRIESKQGFISVAVGKMSSNQVIEIWGDGVTIRDSIGVSDVAKVDYSLIKYHVQNKVLNIGSGEGHSLLAVVQLLEKYLNSKAKIIYKEKRKVDVDNVVLDISNLRSCIEFKPKNLDERIRDFIANRSLAQPYEK